MTHSYRACYFHLIWATKNRNAWISTEIQTRLYSYIGGIVNNNKATLICIGGTSNHVHLLVSFNTTGNLSSLIRDIKAKSSYWIHCNFPQYLYFSWQEGYSAFSVSYSAVDIVQKYIINQEQHHKIFSFEEEYVNLLKKHKIEYDHRFVLG